MRLQVDATARDFVMARLAAAQASARAALANIDDAIMFFVNPDDDKSGKDRRELVESALEEIGCASRALESADQTIREGDVDMSEPEPWEDDEDEEGEDGD